MRVSTSILVALTLGIVSAVSLPADARHLRHNGREPNDITLTIKHSEQRLEPVEAVKATASIDKPHVSMLREETRALQQEAAKVESIPAAVSAPETPAPPTKSSKRSKGTCIGPLCGISLFFTLIWVTFAVCAVVVYVVDQRFNPWNEADTAEDAKKPQKRRMSGGVDVVRQATAYYQNVAASINATLLRRRPLS